MREAFLICQNNWKHSVKYRVSVKIRTFCFWPEYTERRRKKNAIAVFQIFTQLIKLEHSNWIFLGTPYISGHYMYTHT